MTKFQSLLLAALAVTILTKTAPADDGPYKEDWQSLSKHEAAPEWFQDTKLGIYFHWGVYAVPAYASEWYPRLMHLPGHPAYNHHLEKYGHPSRFGYHDFVPMFKAEHFDAEEWAKLFERAGARFAGPVAGREEVVGGDEDAVEVVFGDAEPEDALGDPWDGGELETALDFGDMGQPNSDWTFQPSGSGTRVTWGLSGEAVGPLGGYFAKMMDGWVGKDYEDGLQRLKQVIESAPAE